MGTNRAQCLESFCELFGEGALRTAIIRALPTVRSIFATTGRTIESRSLCRRLSLRSLSLRSLRRLRSSRRTVSATWRAAGRTRRGTFGLRRLRWIGPQQAVFQWCSVKPADNRVHFLGVRRFDKREAFRLLRFRIADDFNCVRDQVLGTKPAPDIVRGDPNRQIAKEYGEAHSAVFFNSIGGGLPSGGCPRGNNMLPHWRRK